jgi:CheY-like chemotaxis protein
MAKILVGDDKIEFFRGGLERALQDIGVDFANSPQIVLELARKTNYDVIVTDLQYTEGGVEGFGVLQNIRDLAPVRILWTAAAGMREVHEVARQCGASYVYGKKQTDEMLATIRRLYEARH